MGGTSRRKNKNAMSRTAYVRALRARLRALNDRIDRAIVAGRSYAKDAAAHRVIVSALSRLAA